MKALREGKAAAFLVAGGQGTRLGHEGPKGTFDIGLPSGKSLFQLQAERLLKLSKDCGKTVPWYIMTSRDNHAATTAFFEVNHFFGLNRNDVMFFSQAELPVLDSNGKVLLAEKGRVSLGPNGNGGCFPALKSSGALEDMKRRGVEWVFTYSVDNALVKVCDPAFIGFTLASNLPAASKAVAKSGPSERVGVFCLRNDGPSVIEYSEMTPEMCAEKNAQGRLVYGAAMSPCTCSAATFSRPTRILPCRIIWPARKFHTLILWEMSSPPLNPTPANSSCSCSICFRRHRVWLCWKWNAPRNSPR